MTAGPRFLSVMMIRSFLESLRSLMICHWKTRRLGGTWRLRKLDFSDVKKGCVRSRRASGIKASGASHLLGR
jgi:hypothetical protein